MRRLLTFAGALWLASCGGAPGKLAQPLSGTFALQYGKARTQAYMIGNALWFTAAGSQQPLRRYDLDMTKYLHAIVISGDFRNFEHVHPRLESDGRFVFTQPLPQRGYYLFADADPHGYENQVFRFSLGLPDTHPWRDLSESATRAKAGPYTVTLSGAIGTKKPAMLIVRISKRDAPASDLHPYLGALAHAVFINTADLSYLHVHPMALSAGAMLPMSPGDMAKMTALPANSTSSPAMVLQVPAIRAGVYKLWVQFRGGSQLYAAPFVLRAA